MYECVNVCVCVNVSESMSVYVCVYVNVCVLNVSECMSVCVCVIERESACVNDLSLKFENVCKVESDVKACRKGTRSIIAAIFTFFVCHEDDNGRSRDDREN